MELVSYILLVITAIGTIASQCIIRNDEKRNFVVLICSISFAFLLLFILFKVLGLPFEEASIIACCGFMTLFISSKIIQKIFRKLKK